MKRGITVERKYDHNDIPCIVIKKKRGKLALDEIQDILRFEDYQQWNGQYVLFLNCSEATLGGKIQFAAVLVLPLLRHALV